MVYGQKFAVDFGAVAGARCAFQPLAQQGEHLAIGTATLAGVLVKDHVVESRAQDARLLDDVLVTPVARAADDHAALVCRHGIHRLHQGADGVRVVAVVGNDGGAPVVKQVEAPGRIRAVVVKAGQPTADGLPGNVGCPGSANGCHGVVHLKADAAIARQGNVGQCNALFEGALGGDDVAIGHVNHALALGAVRGHDGVVAVGTKKDHLPGTHACHGHDVRIQSVEHGVAAGGHVLHDDALEHHHVFHGGDVVQSQV